MSRRCRICDIEIDRNRVLRNRFFREIYQDVICKWVAPTKSSLCQPCMVNVMDFYKFKQLSRRNISQSDASEDGNPGSTPEVMQLDRCKLELPSKVLQVLDPDVRPKKVCQRKTDEEKAMPPEEYKKYYHRKMWAKYKQMCSICGKAIVKRRMDGHMNAHNGLEPYSCPHCSMQFNCRVNLTSHIRRMHTVQVACEKCGKVINGQMQLKVHMREVHSGRIFPCPICSSTFRRRSHLKTHMQSFHSHIEATEADLEEVYQCEICAEGFVDRRLYTLHMDRQHPGQQPKSTKADGPLQVKRTLMKKLYSEEETS